VDLPPNKRVAIGLTYIFGLGHTRARRIVEKAGVDASIKIKDLDNQQVTRIRQAIEEEGGVMGDLQKNITMNIKRLMEIGSYRGLRHRRSLPVRGQRTHTNARTRKGPRRPTVARKKAPR
jgi:small subunit ribosomal protein S13